MSINATGTTGLGLNGAHLRMEGARITGASLPDQVPQLRPIEAETERLQKALYNLDERLSMLSHRLKPVLCIRPERDGEPGISDSEPESKLGETLRDCSYKAERMSQHIDALLDDLAL